MYGPVVAAGLHTHSGQGGALIPVGAREVQDRLVRVCLEAELTKDLAHLGVLAGGCGVEPLDVGVPGVYTEPFEEAKPDIIVAR
jgi:hypothetical protein